MSTEANRQAILAYERSADGYARLIDAHPPPPREAALRRLLAGLARGATVLEVGSGTGRDADFLESHGVHVRRTDATRAFLDMQLRRGKQATRLDVLDDPFGGPFDAVMAMCVLLHLSHAQHPDVLRKTADALRPGGLFLVCVRTALQPTDGPHISHWQGEAFGAVLAAAGLQPEWENQHADEDGDRWLTVLARKTADVPRS